MRKRRLKVQIRTALDRNGWSCFTIIPTVEIIRQRYLFHGTAEDGETPMTKPWSEWALAFSFLFWLVMVKTEWKTLTTTWGILPPK